MADPQQLRQIATAPDTPITSQTLEDLYTAMPTGSLDRSIINNLIGINHRQTPGMLPSNRDMPGLTFFTRPQLNMQRNNIRNARKLSQLISDNPLSMQRYIRCMLDPRLIEGLVGIPALSCPIVDNKLAFIPVLTNNCLSQSGWPSISVPTFTSKPGRVNEAVSMVDGVVDNHEVWDLNVNFRNTRGDPILYLIYSWVLYMSYVFEGRLVPYIDMISENEIDYCTRIYRLVLDYKKQRVTKIAATHASFPIGVPIGDPFNSSGDRVYSEANSEISVTFRCMGVDYFDDILVKEFNETVAIFNPEMDDAYRDQNMIAVPHALINAMNFKGYPYINPQTSELQWYIPLTDYAQIAQNTLDRIQEYDSSNEIGD